MRNPLKPRASSHARIVDRGAVLVIMLLVMKLARRPLATRLHEWSLTRLGIGNSDPATNGEYRFLEELPESPVVFDVGAHHGDYAAAVLERRPRATVHCFEPAAETFHILASQMRDTARLYRIALADRAGTQPLYGERVGSEMASLFQRDLGWLNLVNASLEEIETRTLDEVCLDEHVEHIDLLKIDTEGAEYLVLLGARRMLAEQRIDRIVFEYGGTALDSHFFLREFFQLLAGHTLFRVLPDGLLPLGRYRAQLEVAQYANYAAIPTYLV
jgi:FkbM family methyltransferase